MHLTASAVLALAITAKAATTKDSLHSILSRSQSYYQSPTASYAIQSYPAVSSHTKESSAGKPKPTRTPDVFGTCPMYGYGLPGGKEYTVYCDAAVSGVVLTDIGPRQVFSGLDEITSSLIEDCVTRCDRNNACVAFNFDADIPPKAGIDAVCTFYSAITPVARPAHDIYAYIKSVLKHSSSHSSSLVTRTRSSTRPPFPTGSASHSSSHSTSAHSTASHSTGSHTSGSHSTASHSTGSHTSGSHSTASHSTGSHLSASHTTGSHSTSSHSTGAHSTTSHSTASHSSASHSTASHSMASHSTASHSTASHSTGSKTTSSSISTGTATPGDFVNWKTYKANGVNIGAWLEQEQNYDVDWWAANIGDYPDEWTWCGAVGFDVCGPPLEKRFGDWITKDQIDTMGKLKINTLRIPTTYAAWVKVPGSNLYHGNQQEYLMNIVNYAISQYNMHIILGLHSLPGGVNTLQIGEAFGHDAWFQNQTNLDYSYEAIDSILAFIQRSGHINAFTIAPINEASDNFAKFATPEGLTANGTAWVNKYIYGCLDRIAKVDKRIPLMLQDSFFSEQYWSPFYPADTNMVIDSHIYFFAASGIYSQYVAPAICGQAKFIGEGDGKFPVFIGEWSLQVLYNNSLSDRKRLYDTQRHAYNKYAAGSAFWNYQMLNDVDTVDGEGKLQDYWSWIRLANAGVVSENIAPNSTYCS